MRKRKRRKPWTPLEPVIARPKANGVLLKVVEKIMVDTEAWGNSRYLVHVRRVRQKDGTVLIHLSIHNHEKTAEHDWRDYQRIKNEICGPEAEAVELYPAESRLVDTSNEFHLWCLQGVQWPIGYGARLVSESGDPTGSVQRPWEKDSKPDDLKYISMDDIASLLSEEQTSKGETQ